MQYTFELLCWGSSHEPTKVEGYVRKTLQKLIALRQARRLKRATLSGWLECPVYDIIGMTHHRPVFKAGERLLLETELHSEKHDLRR